MDSNKFKEYKYPVSERTREYLKKELVTYMRFHGDFMYVDTCGIMYEFLIGLLKSTCVAHMIQLYFNSISPLPTITRCTRHIKTAVQYMISLPYFVDYLALSYWLEQNRYNKDIFESVVTDIKNVFLNLYDNLWKWVIFFKNSKEKPSSFSIKMFKNSV